MEDEYQKKNIRMPIQKKEIDDEEDNIIFGNKKPGTKPVKNVNEWKNSVLVIVPVRLGLNKINKEYYIPIL